MIAIRVLQLLLFAGIAVLVLALLRRAGVDSRWRIPVFCALVVYGFEPAFSIYNILSTAFLLACMGAVLEWQRGGQARWIWLAGILAGLEFGAKQNVAVLAAVALGVPLLARFEWRALARAAAGFTAAVAAVSAGVWFSGGWAKFVEYGFTAKGKFLATAFPLSTTVAQFITGMRETPSWTYQLRLMYSFLALGFAIGCLVLVAAAMVARAWWQAPGNELRGMLRGGRGVDALSHLGPQPPGLCHSGAVAGGCHRGGSVWASGNGGRLRWRCSGSCRPPLDRLIAASLRRHWQYGDDAPAALLGNTDADLSL